MPVWGFLRYSSMISPTISYTFHTLLPMISEWPGFNSALGLESLDEKLKRLQKLLHTAATLCERQCHCTATAVRTAVYVHAYTTQCLTGYAGSFHFWFDCNDPLRFPFRWCRRSAPLQEEPRNTAFAPRYGQAPLLTSAKLCSSHLPSSVTLAPSLQDFSQHLTSAKLRSSPLPSLPVQDGILTLKSFDCLVICYLTWPKGVGVAWQWYYRWQHGQDHIWYHIWFHIYDFIYHVILISLFQNYDLIVSNFNYIISELFLIQYWLWYHVIRI